MQLLTKADQQLNRKQSLKIQTLKNTDLKKRRRQKALSVMITDGSTPTATLLFWGAIVFGLTVGLLLSPRFRPQTKVCHV